MKNFKFLFVLLALNAMLFTACDKDNDPANEEELITTVKLTLTLNGPVDTSHHYYYRDIDGLGGNAPVSDIIRLTVGQAYLLHTEFLDESDPSNIIDITEEVSAEAADHLICYEATGSAIAPTVNDIDANGNPLGLTGEFTPTNSGTGSLKLALKHQPDKAVSDPCSTGDTDVEVTFEVTVQ